ncbi:diphthine synthase [Candidatus Bathyarchaeota archaeon]|nr:diphthine synthase [Candidatus Bathyarchaeota archaeon]
MPYFTFIGLGLHDEKGLTLEGLEEAKKSDVTFAEFYTNLMPQLNLTRLESAIGKKIRVLDRTQLEEHAGEELINAARDKRVSMLVPGDPMIATTHVSLRLELAKRGIKARIIHAASITSAICGATGLQSYKFGKSVTIPSDDPLPNSVLETLSENRVRGLHTLLLLDVRAGKGKQLSIDNALMKMMRANPDLANRLMVGAARVGASDEKVKAAKTRELTSEDFGAPPHSIVAVGRLHFMEAEALKVLCSASESDLRENS